MINPHYFWYAFFIFYPKFSKEKKNGSIHVIKILKIIIYYNFELLELN